MNTTASVEPSYTPASSSPVAASTATAFPEVQVLKGKGGGGGGKGRGRAKAAVGGVAVGAAAGSGGHGGHHSGALSTVAPVKIICALSESANLQASADV